MLFSTKHCEIGLASRPRRAIVYASSSVIAIPPPVPPSVNAGRTMSGTPVVSMKAVSSSIVSIVVDVGIGSFNSSIFCLNRSRSSPSRIVSSDVPSSSIPYWVNTPASSRSRAKFNAVCPPTVARTCVGRSFSMISVAF